MPPLMSDEWGIRHACNRRQVRGYVSARWNSTWTGSERVDAHAAKQLIGVAAAALRTADIRPLGHGTPECSLCKADAALNLGTSNSAVISLCTPHAHRAL